MSSELQEAQSNCINEKCTNLITIHWFRNLYRKPSLGDLSVPNWLRSFHCTTGTPYDVYMFNTSWWCHRC